MEGIQGASDQFMNQHLFVKIRQLIVTNLANRLAKAGPMSGAIAVGLSCDWCLDLAYFNEQMLIRNETQMRHLGATIMGACDSGGVIALHGNLGTGKTTLARGALESLGVSKGVQSPTYTLIEYYAFDVLSIAHFDLYRLAHGEELEYLGYRDY